MKRLTLLFTALCAVMTVSAQEVVTTDNDTVLPASSVPAMPASSPYTTNDSIVDVVSDLQSFYEPLTAREVFDSYHRSETLHLPLLNTHGQVMRHTYMPYYYGGWQPWELHPGLNVNLGASVFAMLGKHAPHGAGFGQNAALMYALPLTDRLTLAFGGYFSNLTWQHSSYQNAGLTAVLDYRFDEHWEAFVYGQKSIVRSHPYPLPLYDLGHGGDRLGAGVRYHFNPSTWIEVSVETSKYDHPGHFTHPHEKFEYKR